MAQSHIHSHGVLPLFARFAWATALFTAVAPLADARSISAARSPRQVPLMVGGVAGNSTRWDPSEGQNLLRDYSTSDALVAIDILADPPMEARIAGEPAGFSKTATSSIVVAAALLGLIFVATLPILFYQGALPFLSVTSYIVCLCMVKICVKEVFMSGFKYPYTVTTLHMLFTSVFACLIDPPRLAEGKSTFALSVVKAASLGLNNMALVFGTTAFVSIIGSCTPATTYLVELVRYRSPTFARTVGVMTVCGGTMLCVNGELSFSVLSFVLASGACCCRSLKAVWSHDLLEINMSAYRLAAWSSIWSFAFMVVPALIQEGLAPWRAIPSMTLHAKVVLAMSCAIATWLNIVMCFCLKYLGPVQQNVFGQLELLAVIILSIVLLHEVVTPLEWVGIGLIISGCLFTKLDGKIQSWYRGCLEVDATPDTKKLNP